MALKDSRIDAYIEKAQPFAQPVLTHLRKLVHKACPDVTETIKWGMPHFDYHGIMCNMASFKQHCVFGFWKASLMNDPNVALTDPGDTNNAMGSFGRMTSMKDLPDDKVILSLIKEAMKLNEEGIKLPTAVRKPGLANQVIEEPDYLKSALKKNAPARKTWEAFSPSNRKEYLEWLVDAKTDATREKRLATTLEQLAEGKTRHWKYQKKQDNRTL